METKSTKFEKKDINMGKRTAVLGYATYNNIDRVNDIARPGMFTKSIDENPQDVRLFLNHDKKMAVGKPGRFWETKDNAMNEAYLGTHTAGNDTLIMLDEGIITDVSFGFDPIVTKALPKKIREIKEAKLWEISPLTHWGANAGSYVASVTKSFEHKMDLKALTIDEQALIKKLITNNQDNLSALIQAAYTMDQSSDLWTSIMYYISRIADITGSYMSNLYYGSKDAGELKLQLKTMERFVKDTKASDDAILGVQSNIESVKSFLSTLDTDDTRLINEPSSSEEAKEFADSIYLLTLKHFN